MLYQMAEMTTRFRLLTFAFLACYSRAHVLVPGDTCTYTFNVPASEEYGCHHGNPSHHSNELQELKEHLNNQHDLLGQQMSTVIDGLNRLAGEQEEGENNVSGEVGITYIVWGKTACPDTAELIYDGTVKGFVGKSAYDAGGGGNYMCLPKDPTFKPGSLGGFQSNAYMYGAEYQVASATPAFVEKSLHDNDVPCAVCDVTGRTRLLTIPAKMECPASWTKEYQGLLMTEHHTHRQSEFICVADNPEVLDGGSANDDGGLLYVVEAKCGSLKCPPYVDGYEFTCVVCTK